MKVTSRYEISKEMYEYANGDIGEHVGNIIVRELCKKIADIIANGGEYIFRMTPNDIMENPYTNSLHYQRYVLYEPLIRCKDCVHWERHETWAACNYWSADPYEQAATEADDYCSYGKEK